MIEYGSGFRRIMKLKYDRTIATPCEEELFRAVSYLGESFNFTDTLTMKSSLGMNGKIVIERKDGYDKDHLIVYYEGNDVFHILIGVPDMVTNFIPGDWEEAILRRYYEIHS